MTPEDAQRLLAENRAKIDALDRKIVDHLNDRTRMAEEIGRAKLALGSPILNRAAKKRFSQCHFAQSRAHA
ncbi:MAG: chorismate mutase [Acidobacteriota bacterium]